MIARFIIQTLIGPDVILYKSENIYEASKKRMLVITTYNITVMGCQVSPS